MSITELKNIMKQVNEPNEYRLVPDDMGHPLYWIWKAEGVSLKPINPKITGLRNPNSRFDVFINGQYISNTDYIIKNHNDSLLIFFIKEKFGFNLDSTDVIKINGDLWVL
jgi:hypothetical protein